MRPARLLDVLDRCIAALLRAAQWLILPIVILLFLQWPLRDIVRAYSREANDLGQWIFALYVAASFTSATRARTHLCADLVAQHYPERVRGVLLRAGIVVGLLPWALFVLIAARNIVVPSITGLEAFPDTANFGYFLVKASVWVLAALVLVQGFIDLARPSSRTPR
jgi:TRAP-type mannitol/chloroaromatic compound transport system permease small subunit